MSVTPQYSVDLGRRLPPGHGRRPVRDDGERRTLVDRALEHQQAAIRRHVKGRPRNRHHGNFSEHAWYVAFEARAGGPNFRPHDADVVQRHIEQRASVAAPAWSAPASAGSA